MPHMDPDHYKSFPIAADPPETARMGAIEAALVQQVERQTADGELDARHAGLVALARASAQRVDRMSDEEKGYSAAALITAASKVFDLLPKPVERNTAEFDQIRDMIMAEDLGE